VGKKNKLSKSSLHWFIRSRPYVLLAELRRRFDLEGAEEVRPIYTPEGKTYVGLPERAARLLEELVRERRVGIEYVVDLHARLAIGVYAYDLLKLPLAPHPVRPGLPRHNGATQGVEPEADVDEISDRDDAADLSPAGPSTPPPRPRPWAAQSGSGRAPRAPEPRFGGRRPDVPRREEHPERPRGEQRPERPDGPRREELPERPRSEEPTRPAPAGHEPRRRRRGGKRGSDRPETRSGKQP
jgi:hypothetical protein